MYKLKELKLYFIGNVEPLEGATSDYKSAKIRVVVKKNHSGHVEEEKKIELVTHLKCKVRAWMKVDPGTTKVDLIMELERKEPVWDIWSN